MRTKRAFLIEPGRFEVKTVDLPNLKEHDVLIKINSCGLCSWELNFWFGRLVQEYGGYPMEPGHEFSGSVIEIGSGVTRFQKGETVIGLTGGGFSEYNIVDEAFCMPLDYQGRDVRYALVEPIKCVLTNLRAAAPEPGDYGVVCGCGAMGLWAVCGLAGNFLAGLIAVDIDDFKLDMAKKMGADYVINSKTEDVTAKIAEITGGHMADFVIECTNQPCGLETCVNYLRTGRGRLVMMSSPELPVEQFDLSRFINKGCDVRIGSPGHCTDVADEVRRTIVLMGKGVFHEEEMITHVFHLEEIQTAFEALEKKPTGYIKGLVIP